MAERIRTFIAIELPAAVQRALGQVQDRLKRDGPPVRWVAPDKVHVTLAFLGEIPGERVEVAAGCVARAAAGQPPFAIEAAGVGVFPNPNRPRVVWVGIQGEVEALRALHGRLESELAAQGFPKEGRPFTPHLTIGRVRDRATPVEVRALAQTVTRLTLPSLGCWRADRVVVIRSDLRPEGPIYTPLRALVLGPTE